MSALLCASLAGEASAQGTKRTAPRAVSHVGLRHDFGVSYVVTDRRARAIARLPDWVALSQSPLTDGGIRDPRTRCSCS